MGTLRQLGKGAARAHLDFFPAEIVVCLVRVLKENAHLELTTMMQALHVHLKGGRGGVAIICKIDLVTAQINCVGVGNIEMRMFGSQTKRFVLTPGVVCALCFSVPRRV